jgi:hypothetical protein
MCLQGAEEKALSGLSSVVAHGTESRLLPRHPWPMNASLSRASIARSHHLTQKQVPIIVMSSRYSLCGPLGVQEWLLQVWSLRQLGRGAWFVDVENGSH